MSAQIIDGKAIAEKVRDRVAEKVSQMKRSIPNRIYSNAFSSWTNI